MHVRHRVPTIFNIYMLDVICCALGCVILLWQVSHQEAEQQTAAAKDAEANFHKASQSSREAEERWRSATLEVSSISSEAEELTRQLKQSRSRQALLAAELERSRGERDEAQRLVLLRDQEYEK